MFTNSAGPQDRPRRSLSFFRVFVIAAFALLIAIGKPALAQTTTTTTLAVTSGGSAASSVSAGTVVTLTATVLAGSTPVTPGQVKFCDAAATYCEDFHIVGTVQLNSSGTASVKFRPTVGSHSYKAVFVGTKTNATSASASSSLSVTGGLPTATKLSWAGSTANPVLTSTVNAFAPNPQPTGTVSFIDTSSDNAILGTAPLGSFTTGPSLSVSYTFNGSSDPLEYQAIADFNGDGIPDLVICSYNTLYVFLGNGDGTFKQASDSINFTGEVSIEQIATGDFNSDGIPDLVVVSTGTQSWVKILLGKGDGTFTVASTITPPASQNELFYWVGVGDFNHDGIPDLAIQSDLIGLPSPEARSTTVLFGHGDGTFESFSSGIVTHAAGYNGPIVADLNGDGIPDLAFFDIVYSSQVDILLGNGDGTFTVKNPVEISTPPTALAAADFNGDGIPDLVVNQVPTQVSAPNNVFLFLGTGGGNFSSGQAINASTEIAPPWMIVGDFNGDGIPDVAGMSQSGETATGFSYLINSGDGTFTQESVQSPSVGILLGAADFNDDGTFDLLTSNYGSSPDAFAVSLTTQQQSTVSLTSTLTDSTHIIEAIYSGDSNFNSSVSPTITVDNTVPPVLPALTSPAPGSHLTGSSATFTWTPDTDVTRYQLWVGTKWPQAFNIYGSGITTATSATVTGLPTDGVNVYVTLWYEINGVWYYTPYLYTAAGQTAPPVLTTPTPGSVLSDSNVTFTWTPGTGVTAYTLSVGTYAPGTFNIYSSPVLSTTSVTVPNIPTDSKPVYITLRYQINGVWQSASYTYTAAPLANPPVMTSPAPGSVLPGSTVTFQWTPNSNVTQYALSVGTHGPGSFNIDSVRGITTNSTTVSGIPTDSNPVYVILWYLINGAVWQTTSYTYTAAPLANPPVMTSPAPGSVLPGSTVTFQWTPNSHVTQYALSVGTHGPGSFNIDSVRGITTNSTTVSGIPTDSQPVYVILWYLVDGAAWQTTSYTYTAQ